MKKVFIFFIFCAFFSNKSFANYIDNIKKINISGRDGLIYERNGSNIVDLMIIFKYSGDAYSKKNGVNEFANLLISMGSKNYNHRDFANEMKNLSATFDVSSNIDNSYLHIKTLKKNFSKVVNLSFEALFDTNLCEENFQLAKTQIFSSIKSDAQNYEYLANQAFLKEIFKNQLYQPYDLTVKDVEKIEKSDIKDYIYNILINSEIKIVAAGDLDEKILSKNLEDKLQKFGKLDDTGVLAKINENVSLKLFSKPKFISDKKQKAQTIFHFVQKAPKISNEDYVVLQLINDYIGGGGLNSKLMKKLREEMNITYSARTSIVNLEKINYISGNFATGSKDKQKIIDEVKVIFNDIRYNGINDDELKILKAKFYGKDAMNFSDNTKALYDLMFLMQNDLPVDFYNTRKIKIDQITHSDITRVAKKYLDDKNLSFVIFG